MRYDFSRIAHLWNAPRDPVSPGRRIAAADLIKKLSQLEFLRGYQNTSTKLDRLQTRTRATIDMVIDQVISALRADTARTDREERRLEMRWLDAIFDNPPQAEKRERALRDFQARSPVLTTKELKSRLKDALLAGPRAPRRLRCLVCGSLGRRYFIAMNPRNPVCKDHAPSTPAGRKYYRMVAWAGGEEALRERIGAAVADRLGEIPGKDLGRFWSVWRSELQKITKEYDQAIHASRLANVQKASAGRLAKGRLGGRPPTISPAVLKRAAGGVRRGIPVEVAARTAKISVATLRRYLLSRALDAIRRGTPVPQAAQCFSVRETTLRREFVP